MGKKSILTAYSIGAATGAVALSLWNPGATNEVTQEEIQAALLTTPTPVIEPYYDQPEVPTEKPPKVPEELLYERLDPKVQSFIESIYSDGFNILAYFSKSEHKPEDYLSVEVSAHTIAKAFDYVEFNGDAESGQGVEVSIDPNPVSEYVYGDRNVIVLSARINGKTTFVAVASSENIEERLEFLFRLPGKEELWYPFAALNLEDQNLQKADYKLPGNDGSNNFYAWVGLYECFECIDNRPVAEETIERIDSINSIRK